MFRPGVICADLEVPMMKVFLLALVIVAGVFVWKQHGTGSHDELSELQSRLDAAERSFMSAGRSAGLSGMDTTADASSALAEVQQVERELRQRSRTATPAQKLQIDKMLAHASTVESKMR
jgi:hypothetical protein